MEGAVKIKMDQSSAVWPRNTKLALAAAAKWVKRASERIIKKANRCSEASPGAIRHSIIDHKFVTVKKDYSFPTILMHYS